MNNNYLIYGNDNFLIKNNIKKIINSKESVSPSVIYYNMEETSIEQVIEELNTFDLFENIKIVICEKSIFLSSEGKKDQYNTDVLIEYLEKAVNDNILILTLEGELDERKKIVKDVKKLCNVVKHDKLKDYEIIDVVAKKFQMAGYKINKDVISLLISRTGNDLGIINNEIQKLFMYKLDEKIITNEDVLELVPKRIEDNIFDLVDAVVERKKDKIFELYAGLTNYYGEEQTKILIMIANQFRLMLQCKILNSEGLSESDIAKELKIHPYRVKLAIQKSKNIEIETLTKYLNDLAILDLNIKSGKTNKDMGLELFFLNM